MNRTQLILLAAGGSLADVVDLTSYHTDMSLMGAFMKAKNAAIGEPYPAWTAIGISTLYEADGVVEIKIVAQREGE